MTQLKVTQIKSAIGTKQNHRASLRTLGLRKIRQSVVRDDTPQVRGLIHTVRHLVVVEEVK
ncbi:50S ribosomal protein L30 [Prauserella marina]|uniref:Large ribosomal subunit protein uL30 n=1 Tax=Prauserella marina TaxID=530584 RepID=A0A222VK56_9PSEU|nr:50S ribosomal protein L30 [Prauserella marina]ASR34101.1 50S ribosomal protein L30 [Prauserella marina]PWV82740.1 LSU ribosomal protein L30P [Prauserella marina]SDC76126.1 large subunit ribosomal protein L30 [Prauserella marina]